MKILGVDPGGTTGLAIIQIQDKKITPVWIGQSKDQSTKEYVQQIIEVDVLVVEDWKTDPRKSQRGAFSYDPMITTRLIGKLELLAEQHGKKFVLQPNSIKPVGYGFSNQVYVPGKKGMHQQDALAHAVYYAVRVLGANPVRPK